MGIKRKKVGKTEHYKGHEIEARYMGPDLLCCVDGQEVGHFYLTAEAARAAGRRHIDQVEKEGAEGATANG